MSNSTLDDPPNPQDFPKAEEKINYGYYIFIALLTPMYSDYIISGLVRQGFSVTAINPNGEVTIGAAGNPSATLGLHVLSIHDKTARDVYNDLNSILQDIKAYYYTSVIIEATENCIWTGSNIYFPDLSEIVSVPTPKSDLN